jgi:O-succinylbenzoic acid--CoA ligase
MNHIDWLSDQTDILLNPRTPQNDQQETKKLIHSLPTLKAHVWLSTSGSSGIVKWAALSKEAIINSAKAVNTHLQSTSRDIWLNPLPLFHVGGLGILARGFANGASVVNFKKPWNAQMFCEAIVESNATLTALVPTQVYDLVNLNVKSSVKLRAVIVGGGRLSEPIYQKARKLGWPLLPSYGLTECGSQVATPVIDRYDSDFIQPKKVLDHLQVKIDEEGRICVKGSSLLTCYAIQTSSGPQLTDPKLEGWYHTEDLGSIQDGFLHVHGRKGDFIKIGGESVDLSRLEKILDEIKINVAIDPDNILIAAADLRLGHVIHLVTTNQSNTQQLVKIYNEKVMPFERIRHVHQVSSIPRSPLNKVLKRQLSFLLNLPIL